MDAETISKLAENGSHSQVDVLGLLAPPFKPGVFTPNNVPEKGQWIWADIPALVEHAGGGAGNVQPVVVEATFGAYWRYLSFRCFKRLFNSCKL
jgi:surfeit locus 1 family protein